MKMMVRPKTSGFSAIAPIAAELADPKTKTRRYAGLRYISRLDCPDQRLTESVWLAPQRPTLVRY